MLRGHLELLDVGDPGEVAETRELLLDEVDRMSRLVGDLILLAKSDRPDFVTPRPVDLAGADRRRARQGPRARRPDVAARRDAREVTVPLDEQRLTQALLQLCDNAVKHTAPRRRGGARLVVRRRARVELWVRDTGPGVPDADRAQVFERFGRSAVPDGDEGFGLGLSIVHAIAHAHGGTVHVEDGTPARRLLRDHRCPAARRRSTDRGPEPAWPAS